MDKSWIGLGPKMASKPQNSNQKRFIFALIILSLSVLTLVFSFRPPIRNFVEDDLVELPHIQNPKWLDLIKEEKFKNKRIKVGLVNIDTLERHHHEIENGSGSKSRIETHHVSFEPISTDLKWKDFFPTWINEDERRTAPKCPKIPLAAPEKDLDVVVARVPCEEWRETEGMRDLLRLQINLVVANLAAGGDGTVLVVFEGLCGPMQEIFRCDDLVKRVDEYWVYRPDMIRLKQKATMPVGSCQIAPPLAYPGKEVRREAYVTVLHSSEAYVCGAITLGQSIIRSNSTRDLILLHDKSITLKSQLGLRAAGWKLRGIHRIRSPFSQKHTYNEWNYSKLRVWQLIDYDKLIFIDADILVLKNLDYLFYYPQLSASPNARTIFNSGVMLVEPSVCTFEDLMLKSFKVVTYNGGDQGFLNEVFTWWHRWPKKVNFLKQFDETDGKEHKISDDLYSIHYLGLKPWMCYRDYDCNWDVKFRQIHASDSANMKWWEVYDAMPKELQRYCALSPKMDYRIRKCRGKARNVSLADSHWKIEVKDPRKDNLVL